ncbi:T9SS type A sorting domain-containing protein [uncultured Tenacibaculum sp.]|uniref:T9SS type A sorting domain-containing protein n=1 Tax=uncultured Tenacibaculum sp. TaxID=174713 RepID=UPI00262125F8|nr:T9SS type A sorting domain-containing protein [uncultured Tenacibaculum sp.]
MKPKIKVLFLALLLPFFLFSQNFIEKQLPSPSKLSSFFIGPLIKSTIHYGERPSNFNGEVLLFNHGYIDLNQLFFTNNTFYQDAYNEGYQVVFVATTRGKGLWENGKLLAESIDIITNKYQINDLTVIAHSNGGKAAEAAMFSYNKRNKVKKVIALGTPYWGTYLADISQQWWFNWIWKNTGLNEGAATSTTYYCRDVVRPLFDNASNNQPEKFIILGASGFKNGHTLLAPLMFTSGGILYLAQGTNDGVTPYSSSLRPGATYLFNKGEAKLDHIDVALGQYVWNTIKPYLNANFSRKSTFEPAEFNYNTIISDYQIINSENNYDKIIAPNNSSTVNVDIFHEKSIQDFKLYGNSKLLSPLIKTTSTNKIHNHSSSYQIKLSERLVSNSRFAAFIHFPEGPKMKYINQQNNDRISIKFDDISVSLENIKVDAVITKTSDLYGKTIDGDSFVYSFSLDNDEFNLNTSDFEDGVYSIHITGKHSDFTRSIASGFVKGRLTLENIQEEIDDENNLLNIDLKSNTIVDRIEIISTKKDNQNIKVSIFNLNGQLQITEQFSSNENYTITNNVSSLAKGLYILSVEKNNLKKSFKILKK